MAKASLVDRIEYAQMAIQVLLTPLPPHYSGKIKKHGHINRSEIFRNFVSFLRIPVVRRFYLLVHSQHQQLNVHHTFIISLNNIIIGISMSENPRLPKTGS